MNDGLICISTCAETAEELRLQLDGADATGDAAEVRFDCLRPDELQKAIEMIGSIGLQIPLIATFRSPAQGGRGRATFDERVQFWQSLPNDYFAVDLEDDIIQFAPAGVRGAWFLSREVTTISMAFRMISKRFTADLRAAATSSRSRFGRTMQLTPWRSGI